MNGVYNIFIFNSEKINQIIENNYEEVIFYRENIDFREGVVYWFQPDINISNFSNIKIKIYNTDKNILYPIYEKEINIFNNFENDRANKTCIAITSYCNNLEKKEILINNINILKKLNLKILLHSNRMHLEKEYESVNYYLFDDLYLSSLWKPFDTNSYHWCNYYDYILKTESFNPGYPVFNQIKIIMNYLKVLGYTNLILLNYDIVISNEILNDINNFLNGDVDEIVYYNDNRTLIQPLFFIISIDKYISKFTNDEEYLNIIHYESYLTKIFKGSECSYQIKDSITYRNLSYKYKDFEVFVFNNNNKLNIFAFDIKDNKKNMIDFICNDKKYSYQLNNLIEVDNNIYYCILETDIDLVMNTDIVLDNGTYIDGIKYSWLEKK